MTFVPDKTYRSIKWIDRYEGEGNRGVRNTSRRRGENDEEDGENNEEEKMNDEEKRE